MCDIYYIHSWYAIFVKMEPKLLYKASVLAKSLIQSLSADMEKYIMWPQINNAWVWDP